MAEFDEKLSEILNNPQAMGQIMALANSLGGGDSAPSASAAPPPVPAQTPPPALGNLNPQLLGLGSRLLGEYQRGDDDKVALLRALRPFLRPQRYEKLDRAIEVARLSRVIRLLFDSMGKGEERV